MTPMRVARRLANRLLAIGENRFQLLAVEVQEERNRLVDMVFLGIAAAALGLLGAIAFSAVLVILLWPTSPLVALIVLGSIYWIAAAIIGRRLLYMRNYVHTLSATMEQLRKDRACLKGN
jgi:uncharacterized membrane protein YqjE